MPNNLKVGVIGGKIILTVTETLVNPTVMKIYYKKPVTGDTGSFTAVEETSTSISYTTTASGEIDVDGIWGWESYVEMDGFTGYGDRVFDQVDPHL